MRKRLICILLCLFVFLSGCDSSTSSASGSQDDFLKDMAAGISKRLKESQSVDTDSMSKEERMKYYSKFVSYELKEIEKYNDVGFSDSNFNTLAHLYIDACQMQLAATENYKNNELYTALWDGGYKARAGIIVALYEQYNLPITEEQANNYRPTYTVTSVVTETEKEEPARYEISVEEVTFDIYNDGGCYANVKVRNNGELTLTDISCNVDAIDKNGDVVVSSITYYEGRVDTQQACTSGAWFDEVPYAVRVTGGYCIDDKGNWIDFYLDTPYVDYSGRNASTAQPSTNKSENNTTWDDTTKTIMGTWKATYYYSDGEVVSGSAADFEALFVMDGTGHFILDGDKYSMQWSFSEELDDMLLYKLTMDGDTRYIGYVTDATNDFYNRLMFQLDEDLYVILKKTSW